MSPFNIWTPRSRSSYNSSKIREKIDTISQGHFGFEGIPNFKRDHVLNHLAGARRAISRGRTLQGCLLGIHDPMPDSFPHGAKIPAFVSIWDQFFTEYRRPVLLWADRMRVPIQKSLAPRRNLLDHKDPEPVKKNRIPI